MRHEPPDRRAIDHGDCVQGRQAAASTQLHGIAEANKGSLPAGSLICKPTTKPSSEQVVPRACLFKHEPAFLAALHTPMHRQSQLLRLLYVPNHFTAVRQHNSVRPTTSASSASACTLASSCQTTLKHSAALCLLVRAKQCTRSAAEGAVWQAASWHELLRPQVLSRAARSTAQDVGHAVGQLLSGPVRRTSLLLMFIWFANALNYYGLVLLTTTVRPLPVQKHTLHPSHMQEGWVGPSPPRGVLGITWSANALHAHRDSTLPAKRITLHRALLRAASSDAPLLPAAAHARCLLVWA